ncbi:unnamed protein product, partial [Owenia fusiformis]
GRRKYFQVNMNFGRNQDKTLQAKLGKQWVHPAEAMVRGHIVYNVKFLGHCEVDQPKGTEVVKDAIRKMKFNKQLKKAEGQKPPKVELTISADGVTVQDPKSKIIQHQYPLHRISYCADDKVDKRVFTFIAKDTEHNTHQCFVFNSEKCAEEITLTVGQAFDLAYKKFLDSSSKDMDMKKQYLLLQKKVTLLQHENAELKKRLTEMEKLKDRADVEQYKQQQGISNVTSSTSQNGADDDHIQVVQGWTSQTPAQENTPQSQPTVGRKLEGLVFEDNFNGSPATTTNAAPSTNAAPHTNGTTLKSTPTNNPPTTMPTLQPPPSTARPRPQAGNSPAQVPPPIAKQQQQTQQQPTPQNNQQALVDIFGAPPMQQQQQQKQQQQQFDPSVQQQQQPANDPFGMPSFNPSTQQLDSQIFQVNQEMMDLQHSRTNPFLDTWNPT